MADFTDDEMTKFYVKSRSIPHSCQTTVRQMELKRLKDEQERLKNEQERLDAIANEQQRLAEQAERNAMKAARAATFMQSMSKSSTF